MPTTPPHPSSNVAAAAALQFSVDFDPSHGDSQPSVLLLTQNIGGIEAAYGGFTSLLDASPGMSPASDQLNGGTSNNNNTNSIGGGLTGFPSIVATMTSPSYAQVPDDVDAESGVSALVRQQVAEFLADLRTWLHRMSYVSAAARRMEKAGSSTHAGAKTSPTAAAAGSAAGSHSTHGVTSAAATGTSSTRHTASPSGNNPAAGQTAESLLRGYTAAARPPMVDLVVIHFQEVGGKYKNKHFNKYFKEQLSAVVLPEAGWSSGLLMDDRESDRVVVSSSACRRTRTTNTTNDNNNNGGVGGGVGGPVQRPSPTSMTGHLRAPAWDYTDSHSRRSSNDASGTETDMSEEEAADPYFTAMGSIVFLSPRVMGITSCLSVPHRTYIPIVDDPISYAGDAGRLFLSGKFSEAGRSRKGFLMVSLRIGTVQFNVCNVHLFNDDDNRVAFEQSPSKYTSRRTRAVREAFAECSAVVDFQEPFFLFGDYNVRMDGKAFVQWAEEKEQISIRPGKKQLRCPEHLWTFFSDPARTSEFRRAYDKEPQRLMDEMAVQAKVELGEMPVTFAPTYSRVPYRQRGSTNNNSSNTLKSGGGLNARDSANAAAVAAVVDSMANFDEAGATNTRAAKSVTPPPDTLLAPTIAVTSQTATSTETKATPTTTTTTSASSPDTHADAASQRRNSDELNRTQTPSASLAAAAAKGASGGKAGAARGSAPPFVSAASASPPPPQLPVVEALTHVAAAPTRDNFSHDRLPAWCDRVLFNVAGLEWIAGDRARPPAASQSSVRDGRKAADAAAPPPPPRWYAYDAIDFVHMDHDGVYLLF